MLTHLFFPVRYLVRGLAKFKCSSSHLLEPINKNPQNAENSEQIRSILKTNPKNAQNSEHIRSILKTNPKNDQLFAKCRQMNTIFFKIAKVPGHILSKRQGARAPGPGQKKKCRGTGPIPNAGAQGQVFFFGPGPGARAP